MASKRYSLLYLRLILSLIVIASLNRNSWAQPELFGEVKIEEFSKGKSGNYQEDQNSAIDFINLIEASHLANSAKGELVASSKVSAYLTSLYLYCLKKSAVCPFALDAVLVADYYNNKSSNQGCVNMKNLWRNWVENGFEKRVAYLIPFALAPKFTEFQTTQRPRYLKCEETLKTFKPDQNSLKSVRLIKKLAEQIKEKQINVFNEVGASNSAKTDKN
jgi:hypothetical protein